MATQNTNQENPKPNAVGAIIAIITLLGAGYLIYLGTQLLSF